jgi:small conductance mechanosensitive channel
MEEQVTNLTALVMESLTTYGLSMIGAVIILIIGLWLSSRARKFIIKVFGRHEQLDPMLGNFLASLARYLIIIVTVLAVLAKFGIETTSLLAVFGAAGLAVGLALQGTLSNLAAGIMLLIFRPFKIGDFVEVAGLTGSVAKVTLFVTELTTPDNIQRLIPNGDVWGSAITNYNAHPIRRCDMLFGIAYDADIEAAMAVIRELAIAEARIHSDPEPFIVVSNLGDSSVDITVRVWCDSGDYWGVKFDLTKKVKEAFDARDIDIPFPTRIVHTMANA